ncbi:MAG: exo-alpha-sialidase [Actinomycetota bacterium]|nr:MAG: exo-alpha-sialidase [Actinomycetota bacterium]
MVKVAGDAWSHVHNLAYDGPALLLGTHEGLYRQEPGQPPQLLSETPFDVMGLTNDGTRWLASGHPGAGEDLPSDLGLRASDDGTTWTTLSLLGEVDFHRLTATGSTILGVSAHDNALLRATDAGATFTRLDNPGVYDVALDPGDPTQALATTQTGPMASRDTGASWQPVAGAPLLAFLAWTPDGLYGIAPDGTVHVSTDGGTTWSQRGSTGAQPAAAAADGDRIAVLVGGTVVESTDGGSTFSPRLTGIGGH